MEKIKSYSEISGFNLFIVFLKNINLLFFGSIFCGLLALAYSFSLPQIFTAKTTIMVPTQTSGALGLLGGLGNLSSLAGPSKTITDQYIAYLNSNSVTDDVIEKFQLKSRYQTTYQKIARDSLRGNVKFSADKKAGLISIYVEDKDPVFAADVANYYVTALSIFLGNLNQKESASKRELLERQLTDVMNKSYPSPMVRDLLMQSLIREFEFTSLEEKKKIQYVAQIDVAQVPEFKTKPSKLSYAINSTLISFVLLAFFVLIRKIFYVKLNDSEFKHKVKTIAGIFNKNY